VIRDPVLATTEYKFQPGQLVAIVVTCLTPTMQPDQQRQSLVLTHAGRSVESIGDPLRIADQLPLGERPIDLRTRWSSRRLDPQ
jgi:hypothetical protein